MKLLKFVKRSMVLSLVLMMGGCATIVSGTTQKIRVTSIPSDALAKVDNFSTKTPAVLSLERKTGHTLEISKEGYKTMMVLILPSMNGMTFGNALVGGL